MKFELINKTDGTCFLCLTAPEVNDLSEPGERYNAFSVLTISSFVNDRSIRFCLFKSGDIEVQDSDVYGRALLGVGKTHESWFVDLLFVKVFFE